ncbi:hypothetical protein NIES2109_63140 (plasmid) [Nostoc sp. HK-01]|nr:hypothetical protein NIES2109_63140 [Nostoc sp. HK-01]
MENRLTERPNFKLAIDDPAYFVGRNQLLNEIKRAPCEIRILLGGRRIGKTSLLHAIQWSLLDPSLDQANRTFPVLINLEVEKPQGLDNLRYIMIARLRESIEKWQNIPGATLREMYRSYLRQVVDGEIGVKFLELINVKLKVDNPDKKRQLIHDDFRQAMLKTINDLKHKQFNGVCFLFERAEFIARQKEWANDAWSYFRGLKDTEVALKPYLGFFLSGYRELKEYQQEVGSPLLNIADISWLSSLTDSEIKALIACRQKSEEIPISEKGISFVTEWAGGHPYLTQQMLNAVSNKYLAGEKIRLDQLTDELLQQHDHDFSVWWNVAQEVGGLDENARKVYQILIEQRQANVVSLAQNSHLSPMKTRHLLDVLVGAGIIRKLDNGIYKIGARLFEEWVKQQPPGFH